MTDPAKVRRHAERVRELVAEVVRTQIKDPRLGMITITDSRITAGPARGHRLLHRARRRGRADGHGGRPGQRQGLLRSTVGKALGLKHSPTLTFVHDDVQETVKHIDELLAAARESDAKVHELAAQRALRRRRPAVPGGDRR